MSLGAGRFFEDFEPGEVIAHPTPRTVTAGDVALYQALYGSRFALQSSDRFARACGLPSAPLDGLLVFHVVFGKSVPDISVNAVANLAYAEGVFGAPAFAGADLRAVSEVIGLKETSNGRTGVVTVRTRGLDGDGREVLAYARAVLVNKREPEQPSPHALAPPRFAPAVSPADLALAAPALSPGGYDFALAGSERRFGDYAVGTRLVHPGAHTVEEAEHQLATRLWQNTARVHFDARGQAQRRHGRRLVYGGHVLSVARALSFDGLENAALVAGINAGAHVAPTFAGDTLRAWSEVLDAQSLPGRDDWGALRLRLVAVKDRDVEDTPLRDDAGAYEAGVVLDFDHWVLVPR